MSNELTPKSSLPEPIKDKASYNRKLFSQFNAVLTFFKHHPTLGISVVYLGMSIFGMVYINMLFKNFDVDILPHLEVTDFLLAAFNHPLSMGITAFVVALVVASEFLDKQTDKIGGWYLKIKEFITRPFYIIPPLLAYSAMALVLGFFTLSIAAEKEWESFTENKAQSYNLQLNDPMTMNGSESDLLSGVQVLSDTTRFIWVRQPETGAIYAIPQLSLIALTPLHEPIETKEEKAQKDSETVTPP